MNAKSTALMITFAAIAIALNAVKIPAIFYPGTFYQISQIPIVVAFLLYGARIGILVGVLNLAGGIALFPTGASSIIVYPTDFVSLLLMFSGLSAASRFINHTDGSEGLGIWKNPVIGLTAFAVAFRGGLMPFIDYGVVFHTLIPLVLGISFPEAYIAGLLPVFILYNITVPLYTVPIAYVIATKVGRHLEIEPRVLRQL